MKRTATLATLLLASALLLTGCKNSEETMTTPEGTTITDDANGNVGNSDVTSSPGSNVDQTTGGAGSNTTTTTTNDTVPRAGQPDDSNDTNTGDR